jgi:pyridoxal phosphate enzyme (YggS family)
MTPDSLVRSILTGNLRVVEERIQDTCRRAGRPRSAVTLIAVTKTVVPEVAALVPELGCVDLGESRPQELWHKAAALPVGVRWHLIGHLQRNKIERTFPLVHLIHSVDSLRLLEALDQEAVRKQRSLEVLLEVNAGGEAAKSGFAVQEVPELLPALGSLKQIRICGLMTMAALEENPEQCRPTFQVLRRLAEELTERLPAPHHMEHISMGMSNDFEVAIEEGATLIRLGTILFQGLPEWWTHTNPKR